MNYIIILHNKGYAFDAEKQQWHDNKRAVDVDEPHIFLIRALKSDNVPDAGLKAVEILGDCETSPELTFKAFKKRHLRREYGMRVRGLDVFLAWAKTIGLRLNKENILLWCRRHPFILHRFYAAAERAGIHIKNRARIWGIKGIFSHVFIGFKLVTDTGSGNSSCNTSGNTGSGPAGDDINTAYNHPIKTVFSGALRRSG